MFPGTKKQINNPKPLNTHKNMATTTGTLKYRLAQVKNPQKPAEAQKWYARAVQDRTVGFEDFVTHMAEHNSPYSRGVIHGVLIDMLSCLQELVLDGKSVRLGELGLVSLGISGRGALKREDWTASLVDSVHLNVRNTKTWSNQELRKRCRLSELAGYEALAPDGGGEEGGGGGNPSDGDQNENPLG